jgi:hypothetical protein
MDEYQEGQRLQGSDGKVYVVQGGKPRQLNTAPQQSQPRPPAFIAGTPDPYKANADARAAQDQEFQRKKAAREEAQWKASHNPDGSEKPKIVTDGKPTEYQAKSAGFLGRMLQAEREYGSVPEDSRDPRAKLGQVMHDWVPDVENILPVWMGGNSSDRMRSDQAALNFIAASLRQESGAAIGQAEYDRQYRIFFPMPGDTPSLLKQKARARAQAIEGFKIAAGPLAGQAVKTTQTAPPPPAGTAKRMKFNPATGRIE